MDVVKDFFEINEKIFRKSIVALKKNPLIFVIGVPYGIVYLAVGIIASQVSFFGGMLLLLIRAAIISDYLFIISRILSRGIFDKEDVKVGFKVYFIQVYAILFLLWFINYGMALFIDPISRAVTGGILSMIIEILLFAVLSAVPECIYQKHLERGDLVTYSYKFVKENPFQWLVPNIVLVGISLFAYNLISGSLYFILGGLFSGIVGAVLIQGAVGFIMIYRGFLFQTLSSSSLRKRMFMRNMYKN